MNFAEDTLPFCGVAVNLRKSKCCLGVDGLEGLFNPLPHCDGQVAGSAV